MLAKRLFAVGYSTQATSRYRCITDEALADMEKIYEYIATRLLAPENAMGQYNRIAGNPLDYLQFFISDKNVHI